MRVILLLLLSFAAFAEHKSPHRIRVLPDYDNFTGVQQTTELNIYQNSIYVNKFLEWESADELTIGIYFNNIPLDHQGKYRQTYIDDTYVGIGKWWGKRGELRFGISGQIGTQLPEDGMRQTTRSLLAVTIAQVQYTFLNNFIVSIGPYWANPAMSTVGNYVGTAVNVGWKLSNQLRIEGSWYSGKTNLSGAIINMYYSIFPDTDVYVGVQIPEANSGNEFAGNVGFIVLLD